MSELISREEALAGLPAQQVRALLFAIEQLSLQEEARRQDEMSATAAAWAAAEGERDFIEAFRRARIIRDTPTLRNLEDHAERWASLVPDNPRVRAGLARALASKYPFNPGLAPRLCQALGLDQPATLESFRAQFGAELSTIYAPAAVAAPVVPHVSIARLVLAFVKLGSISIGGRSAMYLQDELVDRLHWLQREDWLEGLLLGRLLPGPAGVGTAMFMAHMLRGSAAAALSVGAYILPGILGAIVLSMLFFDVQRPPWANGAIHGVSAGGFGLFVFSAMKTAPTSRKTRYGVAAAFATFIAYGLLRVDLVLVLIGAGALSLAANTPRRRRKEADR